jgi:hypothetical protein
MTSIIHLQNALNKVVDEAKVDALDRYTMFLKDRLHDTSTTHDAFTKMEELLLEFKASNVGTIINFGPQRKEKKSRPPNSYNLFIKDKMQEIKLAHPEYKGKELMKKATEAWNLQKQTQTQTDDDNTT